MLATELETAVSGGSLDNLFSTLYRDPARARKRWASLLQTFRAQYGDRDVILVSVPGRTEISGNHTDHNNGCVLAASVDIDIIAVAAKTDGSEIRVKSEGYPEDVIDCADLNPETAKKGTSAALIAGICDAFRREGLAYGGFVACTTSEVLPGSGLSSSAAFEVLCAKILSALYNGDTVPAMQLAQAGQYAENVFFGKPCGLMDQAACACGGFLYIDFGDPAHPVTEKLTFDPEREGYTFCIVNTGGSHVDLTDDYASIPAEMHRVAAFLGKRVLRECEETAFVSRLSAARSAVGDRAVLRALHFFSENRRVERQRKALKAGDSAEFFRLVTESGKSSFTYLQNVYSPRNPAEQGISLALAVSERYGAVCRVHGGGFAGTIQAYVPTELVHAYREAIDGVFGASACMLLRIRPVGAVTLTPGDI